jgi:hypothetical protein
MRVTPTRVIVHSPDTDADKTARACRRKTFVSGTCKLPRLLGAQGGWREGVRELMAIGMVRSMVQSR